MFSQHSIAQSLCLFLQKGNSWLFWHHPPIAKDQMRVWKGKCFEDYKAAEKYKQLLRWTGWKREREGRLPGVRIRVWPSIEGLLSLRWQPKLGAWVPSSTAVRMARAGDTRQAWASRHEWQGLFHQRLWADSLRAWPFECKTLVRLPRSSQLGGRFSREKNIPVAVPGMLSLWTLWPQGLF